MSSDPKIVSRIRNDAAIRFRATSAALRRRAEPQVGQTRADALSLADDLKLAAAVLNQRGPAEYPELRRA